MLSVILVGILVFWIVIWQKSQKRNTTYVAEKLTRLLYISGGIFVFCLIGFGNLATQVATERTVIDAKIAMYEEENSKIESDIDRIIKEYLNHEKETFGDLKTEESAITLVTLFPELKSDALVEHQIELYVQNNQEIRELKEEKIRLSKARWLLYFGK